MFPKCKDVGTANTGKCWSDRNAVGEDCLLMSGELAQLPEQV